jgi:hypothetical protein
MSARKGEPSLIQVKADILPPTIIPTEAAEPYIKDRCAFARARWSSPCRHGNVEVQHILAHAQLGLESDAGASPWSAWTKMTQAPRAAAMGFRASIRAVAIPWRRWAWPG